LKEDVSMASGLAVVTVGNVGAFFMRRSPPSKKWPDAPLSLVPEKEIITIYFYKNAFYWFFLSTDGPL
jgi:hypothetical protein